MTVLIYPPFLNSYYPLWNFVFCYSSWHGFLCLSEIRLLVRFGYSFWGMSPSIITRMNISQFFRSPLVVMRFISIMSRAWGRPWTMPSASISSTLCSFTGIIRRSQLFNGKTFWRLSKKERGSFPCIAPAGVFQTFPNSTSSWAGASRITKARSSVQGSLPRITLRFPG